MQAFNWIPNAHIETCRERYERFKSTVVDHQLIVRYIYKKCQCIYLGISRMSVFASIYFTADTVISSFENRCNQPYKDAMPHDRHMFMNK